MARDKYKISLWEDVLTSGHYEEQKIVDIGSNTMTDACRAYEPKLVENINGTHTFTFKMFYVYRDEMTGEKRHNPFLSLLVNERKVKVYWKDQWYDLFIKDAQEDSSEKSITYTCKDAFINELSKNGFNIVLDQELQNNQGTALQLATRVVDKTDWKVLDEEGYVLEVKESTEKGKGATIGRKVPLEWVEGLRSDIIKQYKEEPVYEAVLLRDFGTNAAINQETGKNPDSALPKDKTILFFYSSIRKILDKIKERKVKGADEVFFAYASEYNTERNNQLVINADSYRVSAGIWEYHKGGYYYEGEKKQTAGAIFFGSHNEDYEGLRDFTGCWTSLDFNTDIGEPDISTEYRAKNLIDSPQTIYDPVTKKYVTVYEGGYYGYVDTEYINPQTVPNLTANPGNFTGFAGWTFTDGQNPGLEMCPDPREGAADYLSCMRVTFGAKGNNSHYIRNDGLYQLRAYLTEGLVEGKEYVLQWGQYNDTKNLNVGISKDGGEFNPNTNLLGTGSASQAVNSINPKEKVYRRIYKCNQSVSYEELFNERYGLYFSPQSDDGTTFRLSSVYFFEAVYLDDGTLLTPTDIDKGSIAKTYYTYYKPVDDIEKFVPAYKGTTPWSEMTELSNEYKKVRSISAKESNRFNILQSIAETFECWIRFHTFHEEDGRIIYENGSPKKYITIKNEVGEETGLGFVYGIDLKSISRNIQSDQIVTKTIVPANSNQFGKDGFCSIARSSQNYPRVNFILNFDYYISHDLLGREVYDDLYSSKNAIFSSTNYSNLKKKQAEISSLEKELASLENTAASLIIQLNDLRNNFSAIQEEIHIRAAEQNSFADSKQIVEGEISQKEGTLASLRTRILSVSHVSTIAEARKLVSKISELRELFIEYDKTNTEIKRLKSQKAQLENQINQLQGVIVLLQNQLNNNVRRQTSIATDISNTKGESVKKEKSIATAKETEQSLFDSLLTDTRNSIGYYYNLNKVTTIYDKIAEELAKLKAEETSLEAMQETQSKLKDSAYAEKLRLENWIRRVTNINNLSDALRAAANKENYPSLQNDLVSLSNTKTTLKSATNALSKINARLNTLSNEETGLIPIREKRLENWNKVIEDLDYRFYKKYSSFIQEGSWKNEEYMDDNLYYLDALSVAYTSSRPQVSYNISAARVSAIDEFRGRAFNLGDIAFVQDTEFFGYVYINDVKTPYKEKVLISEITYNFDSPEQDSFKIQNYKTQFEDLFQRITATTQSLQYASGAYNNVADILTAEGAIKPETVQASLDLDQGFVQSLNNKMIVFDSKGMTVSNPSDPTQQTRIAPGGIFVSDNGGRTWRNIVSSGGVSTQYLASGTIDTNKISIIDGSGSSTFKWDSDGINAYTQHSDGSVNVGKFVRFDQYGIYGLYGNDSFHPNGLFDIRNAADFALTWDGFFLKSRGNGGSVEISKDKDIEVRDETTARIRIGRINTVDGEITKSYVEKDSSVETPQTDVAYYIKDEEDHYVEANLLVFDSGTDYYVNGDNYVTPTSETDNNYIFQMFSVDPDKVYYNKEEIVVEEENSTRTEIVYNETGVQTYYIKKSDLDKDGDTIVTSEGWAVYNGKKVIPYVASETSVVTNLVEVDGALVEETFVDCSKAIIAQNTFNNVPALTVYVMGSDAMVPVESYTEYYYNKGKVLVTSGNPDLNTTYYTYNNNTQKYEVAQLGRKFASEVTYYVEEKDLYGIQINDGAGNPVMETGGNGDLWLRDTLKVGPLSDSSTTVRIGYNPDSDPEKMHNEAHEVIHAGGAGDEGSDEEPSHEFVVYQDGYLKASGGTFTGEIIAKSGTIGGWTIGPNNLTSTDDDGNTITLGKGTINIQKEDKTATPSKKIDVLTFKDGNLSITGEMKATSGTIGGWTIEEKQLSYTSADGAVILNGAEGHIESRGNNGEIVVIDKGSISANSGIFSGELQATRGTIGGWTIENNRLVSGSDNNTPIYLNGSNSSIGGQNWSITPSMANFSNVTVSGKIVTSVFETNHVQAVGGSMIFKPSFKVLEKSSSSLLLEGDVREYFSIIEGQGLTYIGVVKSNGEMSNPVLVTEVDVIGGNTKITTGDTSYEDPYSIVVFGLDKDLVIGVNGNNAKVMNGLLLPSGLTMSTFDHNNDQHINNLFIGDLTSFPLFKDRTTETDKLGFGLYCDNAFLRGGLVAENGGITAGLSTQLSVPFSTENESHILLWAGANSDGTLYGDVGNARFKVSVSGSLYAQEALITNSEIRGSDIYAAKIHGTGKDDGLSVYGNATIGIYEKDNDTNRLFAISREGLLTSVSENPDPYVEPTGLKKGEGNYFDIIGQHFYTAKTSIDSLTLELYANQIGLKQGDQILKQVLLGTDAIKMYDQNTEINNFNSSLTSLLSSEVFVNETFNLGGKMQYKKVANGYDLYIGGVE